MTEGKREKCKVCENSDSADHCLLKENTDFFECENDEHFEPIEEYLTTNPLNTRSAL